MGLQYSITAIGSMVMQSANNGLGTVYVTGFTAGVRLKQFFICPFDALATAVSTFCGQNLGAKRMDRVRKGIRDGLVIAILYGLASGLVLIFCGRSLACLFVSADSAEILDAAGKYVRYLGYFTWALGILNVCRLAIQGLGYSGRAVFAGVLEMIARSVVGIGFTPMYGYLAICVSDPAAWLSACFYLVPTCIYCVRKLERMQRREGSISAPRKEE